MKSLTWTDQTGYAVIRGVVVIVQRVLYWIAVLVISLVILVGIVFFLESRDTGSLDVSKSASPPQASHEVMEPGEFAIEALAKTESLRLRASVVVAAAG